MLTDQVNPTMDLVSPRELEQVNAHKVPRTGPPKSITKLKLGKSHGKANNTIYILKRCVCKACVLTSTTSSRLNTNQGTITNCHPKF